MNYLLLWLQLRLYAVDIDETLVFESSRSATEVLFINVNRNINPPVFSNFNNIARTISESAPVGTPIVDLNATDADVTVWADLYVVRFLGAGGILG